MPDKERIKKEEDAPQKEVKSLKRGRKRMNTLAKEQGSVNVSLKSRLKTAKGDKERAREAAAAMSCRKKMEEMEQELRVSKREEIGGRSCSRLAAGNIGVGFRKESIPLQNSISRHLSQNISPVKSFNPTQISLLC